jgi:predicted outer membrane protein
MAALRALLILTCAVATYGSWAKADTACPPAAPAPGAAATGAPATRLSGTIVKIEGAQLAVKTRTGQEVNVNAGPALDAQQSSLLLVGRSVDILGTLAGPNGLVYADAIRHAKDNPSAWPPDCPPAP